MKPTRATASLIAALFSGFGYYMARSIRRPPIRPPPLRRLPARKFRPERRPRVYLFRGFAGVVFSRGMDALAERIEQAGFSATVNEAMICPVIAKDAIRDYRANPAPVVAVGHSVGAACAIAFAGMLGDEGIPVSLVVTIDPNRIARDVTHNVERYINIFQSTSVLGGRDVKPGKGFAGNYASYDLEGAPGDLASQHREDDDDPRAGVEQDSRADDDAGERRQRPGADPLCRSRQRRARIVGQRHRRQNPQRRHAGNARRAIHVPLWSLIQINPDADKTPLAAGRRLIVPQHLQPQPRTTARRSARRRPGIELGRMLSGAP